jgi:hypothetical protein
VVEGPFNDINPHDDSEEEVEIVKIIGSFDPNYGK